METIGHWFTAIQDWILGAAGQWWTYLVTGLLCWIDGFFPPLPSESIVIALSSVSHVHGGPVNLWILLPIAIVGAIAGDSTAYLIGHLVPLEKIFRGERGQRLLAGAHDLFERRGATVLLSGRFIPVYRVAINMVAGAVGFGYRRFLLIDAVGAIVWGLMSAAIGIAAGALFKDNPLIGIVVGVVMGIALGWVMEKVHAWRETRTSTP